MEKVYMSNIFFKVSLMKNDVKVTVPNGTPKILIPSNEVVN
jgi:hypothetical protein